MALRIAAMVQRGPNQSFWTVQTAYWDGGTGRSNTVTITVPDSDQAGNSMLNTIRSAMLAAVTADNDPLDPRSSAAGANDVMFLNFMP